MVRRCIAFLIGLFSCLARESGAAEDAAIFTAIAFAHSYGGGRAEGSMGVGLQPERWMRQALLLRESLASVGSTMPTYILAYGLEHRAKARLSDAGWTVIDVTSTSGAAARRWPEPVRNASEAAARHRRFAANRETAQDRLDGWATALKLGLWQQTQFSKVLWADLDVCFSTNPDPLVAAWHGIFGASPETMERPYPGLNTHLMLMRPDFAMHEVLKAAAEQGIWLPYTNTEQDLLESVFHWEIPRGSLNGTTLSDLIAHHHSSRDSHFGICKRAMSSVRRRKRNLKGQ